MYTTAGDTAVEKMIERVKAFAIKGCGTCHRSPTECEVRDKLIEEMNKVEKKHGEVYDTEVRDIIYYEMKDLYKSLGYDPHTLESEL
jgi:hypothetical protein